MENKDKFKIPDNWYVICSSKEEFDLINDVACNNYFTYVNSRGNGIGIQTSVKDGKKYPFWKMAGSPCEENYISITFNEFEEYILPDLLIQKAKERYPIGSRFYPNCKDTKCFFIITDDKFSYSNGCVWYRSYPIPIYNYYKKRVVKKDGEKQEEEKTSQSTCKKNNVELPYNTFKGYIRCGNKDINAVEILESKGGINKYNYAGTVDSEDFCYFISNNFTIVLTRVECLSNSEEFFEYFPEFDNNSQIDALKKEFFEILDTELKRGILPKSKVTELAEVTYYFPVIKELE